ncbi:MAG: AAA family ATPase [Dehalococcoidia bacterium]
MAHRLIGRDHELGVLHEMVDQITARGDALVVRGEAGIGKSALLTAAGRRARDQGMLVLTTAGVQSETHLPFAGLHQLLRPILGGIDDLPPPQRTAIEAAFGVTDAAVPDLFLIALATLNLLGEAAARVPLLIVADDAHWLDRSTAAVLTFIARRLESEPIVLLVAVRDGFESAFDDVELSEQRIGGLDSDAAAALLDAHAPDLAPPVRARLLDDAAGNPLALVELPAALQSEGLIDAVLLPAWLPITTRLERAFAKRVLTLPTITRTLLLVAAVDDGGFLDDVLAATAEILGDAIPKSEILEPALVTGLLEIDASELRFCHPLMRSAIYQMASVSQRRVAHAALAAALGGQPERSIWHRAAATFGTNEDIAADLEAAAAQAQRRGAVVVAAAALERAATLSAAPDRRAARLLMAGELSVQLGNPGAVQRLQREAESLELAPTEQWRLASLQEMIAISDMGDAGRIRYLVELARQAQVAGQIDVALNLLWFAGSRCFWADPGGETKALVLSAAEGIGVPTHDPRLVATLAFTAPIERGAVVIERLSRHWPSGDMEAGAVRLLCTAAYAVGAVEISAAMMPRVIADLRAQGRVGFLIRALAIQAWNSTELVDLQTGITAADEATRLAREIGESTWGATARTAAALLAALRGDVEKAESILDEIKPGVMRLGANAQVGAMQLAYGIAALARGRYQDAYHRLRPNFDPTDSAYHPLARSMSVAYLADAAVHSGNRDDARILMRDAEAAAALTPAQTMQLHLRYARAVLAGDDEAEALFDVALGDDLTRRPFARARLQLAYGAWLRRQRRVAESRLPLRAARDAFDALGVVPWGERARQELRASGETSRRRIPSTWGRLTPQELQIAKMAAEGLSNREIGEQLYLSHRTVSTHLYHIFPKLGITSRTELRAALDGDSSASS